MYLFLSYKRKESGIHLFACMLFYVYNVAPDFARHPDAGSGIQEQEGSSSEPPATSASPSTSTTCTFTPQPLGLNGNGRMRCMSRQFVFDFLNNYFRP